MLLLQMKTENKKIKIEQKNPKNQRENESTLNRI